MSAQLIKTFAQTNKTDFSLDEITRILKDYFGEEDKEDNRNSYKFLKTKWYYGYKSISEKSVYKTIILRIVNEYVDDFRKKLNIDDRQLFNHYDGCKKNKSEYDLEGCPVYESNDNDIYVVNPSIKVVFSSEYEFNDFCKKLNDIKITNKTKTVWYPRRPNVDTNDIGYWTTQKKCNNIYPIYIPSYKRADNMLTVKSLLDLDINNFFVVIKPDLEEVKSYRESMKKLNILDKLIIVPIEYINEQADKGNYNSIPQRNYAYDHSICKGFSHHWCLDDNIKNFYRRHNGKKLPIKNTAYPFLFIEKFCQRYTNVNLASMQYSHLCPANGSRNMIIKNSKVYSCILIKNNNNIKWRGSYNEDIVLTLDTLLKNKSTLTFQNFLCGKQSTGSIKGGNSDIYKDDGQTKKINELLKTHPKYVTKIIKYGHDHHQVNYEPFKNIELGHQKNIELNLPELILENN